jgi:hypothetical protein
VFPSSMGGPSEHSPTTLMMGSFQLVKSTATASLKSLVVAKSACPQQYQDIPSSCRQTKGNSSGKSLLIPSSNTLSNSLNSLIACSRSSPLDVMMGKEPGIIC